MPAPVLERYYKALAAAVLLLAALNLGVRLDSEIVTQWDESLYANSAVEMVQSGDLIATTRHGQLDYYNAKPPLNVWLIALSFKAFGVDLISLRLASVVAAWLTVLVLMLWTRRCFGPAVSLVAGAALTTNFGFLNVHAGRSANTDALLALIILLTVVTLWAARDRRWRLAWLGPLCAATFLLKGMAVLVPIGLTLAVEVVESSRVRPREKRWVPLLAALPLFLLPVGIWAAFRWQIDGWLFLKAVAYTDFIGHTFRALEGHGGSPLFFLNVLQKHEYLWLFAGVVAIVAAPFSRARVRQLASGLRAPAPEVVLIAAWIAFTFVVPTLMRTKLPWYINPFYPAFAVCVALLIAHSLTSASTVNRRAVLALTLGIVFVASESRLIWYSFNYRDLQRSSQGLMLAGAQVLEGRVVFAERWDNAEQFVIRGLVGGRSDVAADPEEFLHRSSPGDFLLWTCELPHPAFTLVNTNGRHWLYRRVSTMADAAR